MKPCFQIPLLSLINMVLLHHIEDVKTKLQSMKYTFLVQGSSEDLTTGTDAFVFLFGTVLPLGFFLFLPMLFAVVKKIVSYKIFLICFSRLSSEKNKLFISFYNCT